MRTFNISSTVPFAGSETTVAENSLKINLKVRNWYFKSLQNVLNLVFEAKDANNKLALCNIESQSDATNSLHSYVITVDGTSLYL